MDGKENVMNEAAVTSHVRLAFADIGYLWRNNVGCLPDKRGIPVRFGLANESPQMNKVLKSSDWIGITPVTAWLHSAQAWCTLGVFTALEIKESGWTQRPGDEHARAQAAYHAIVREAGGFAGFVTSPADIGSIIRRY